MTTNSSNRKRTKEMPHFNNGYCCPACGFRYELMELQNVRKPISDAAPIQLLCGHTICKSCRDKGFMEQAASDLASNSHLVSTHCRCPVAGCEFSFSHNLPGVLKMALVRAYNHGKKPRKKSPPINPTPLIIEVQDGTDDEDRKDDRKPAANKEEKHNEETHLGAEETQKGEVMHEEKQNKAMVGNIPYNLRKRQKRNP